MRLIARVVALAIVVSTTVPAFAQNGRDQPGLRRGPPRSLRVLKGKAGLEVVVAQPLLRRHRRRSPPTAAAPVPRLARRLLRGDACSSCGGRGGFPAPVTISNQTVRQIVRVSVGGDRVRVVLSNAFGTAPVEIGARSRGTSRSRRSSNRHR